MTSDTKIKDISKPWRNWCFTWIEPSEEELKTIQLINADKCKYIIYGHELTSDGKPHIQGYIELKTTQRIKGIKTILDPISKCLSHVHVEPSNADRKYNKAYCSKGLQSHDEYTKLSTKGVNYGRDAKIYEQEFTKVNEGRGKRTDWNQLYERISEEPDFSVILSEYPEYAIKYPGGIQKAIETVKQSNSQNRLHKEMNNLRLYNWEQELLNELNKVPDKRKIIWYVDPIGGTGKSTFAKYLLTQGDCAYFTNAKSADIAHAYNGERIAIFDFTRSVEGRINYEIIESIKNGVVFSAKYNSGLKVNATPHIICFSNFNPEQCKLSQDRWDLRTLSKVDCEYPIDIEAQTNEPSVSIPKDDTNNSIDNNISTQYKNRGNTEQDVPASILFKIKKPLYAECIQLLEINDNNTELNRLLSNSNDYSQETLEDNILEI